LGAHETSGWMFLVETEPVFRIVLRLDFSLSRLLVLPETGAWYDASYVRKFRYASGSAFEPDDVA
jgi:hypothetical protein